MITQTKNISPDIALKYSALYEKATKAMGFDEAHAITSIDQYFACIKELAAIDRKYTILPLDEPVLEIDANTRTITVPADMKKNGIAVQGDEVAEILYFRIDRYFDATDLNNMDIFIQWETAPNVKGVVDKGLSVEWVRDVESEPGKIIFGWPISSAITKNPGQIKFAVRFYAWNDDRSKITYSFSTLNATALINPALNFALDEIDASLIDNVNNMIENRFENSVLVESDKYPVDLPEYLLNLNPVVNLNKETGKYQLLVQAYSPNAGAISYEWYHEKDGGKFKQKLPNETVFLPTQDEEPQEKNIYYIENVDESGVKSYSIYDTVNKDFIKDQLFEKYGACTIDKTGEYYAVAQNRVYLSTKELESDKSVVPMPLVPVVEENLPVRAIIEKDEAGEDVAETIAVKAKAEDAGDLTYVWKFSPTKTGEKAILEGEDKASLDAITDGYYLVIITNHLNNDVTAIESAECRVSHPAVAPEVQVPSIGVVGRPMRATATAEISDEFTYQWYIVTSIKEDDEAIQGAIEPTFTPTIAGKHYVIVTNHVNGTTAETKKVFDIHNS